MDLNQVLQSRVHADDRDELCELSFEELGSVGGGISHSGGGGDELPKES